MERKEIRIEDTWDLSGLFADQAQFDTAMEQAKQLLSEITQRKDTSQNPVKASGSLWTNRKRCSGSVKI